MFLLRQFSPSSSRCSVWSGVCMCVCSCLCMRVHVSVNNVRLFGRFCCVNVLFYVIRYEIFYVSIFVSFPPNLHGVLYVLLCACVSVVFSVCVYMCMLTMCVCLVGFVVLMCACMQVCMGAWVKGVH